MVYNVNLFSLVVYLILIILYTRRLGCLLGTVIVAAIAVGANVAACTPILAIAANRLALTNLQIFLRGILGGLFICLAIFLQVFTIYNASLGKYLLY